MKTYLGQYWILNLLVIGLLIYMARYWYKTAMTCQSQQEEQIGITYPTGKARALVN